MASEEVLVGLVTANITDHSPSVGCKVGGPAVGGRLCCEGGVGLRNQTLSLSLLVFKVGAMIERTSGNVKNISGPGTLDVQ